MMPVIFGCLYAQPAMAQLSVAPPAIKTYVGDPGALKDPSSWRTPEYLRDWGLQSIGAEFAYAAGYAGAEMNIGVVDSGYFLGHMREHGSFDTNYQVGDRFFSVIADGVITSSWGSQPPTENYNTYDPPPNATPAQAGFGINTSWRYLYTPDGTPDANGNLEHWINGAIEVARTGTILQFTAGNGGYQYTTARASAPYFLPELEGRWYTTSGISQTGRTFNADGSIVIPGQQLYNQCGLAKWSCVTAPGQSINSTIVQVVSGVPQARYGSSSGTSMAGPHSAASLALIMKRFPYMTNEQALYTMFTTGRQNNSINGPGTSTPAIHNPTAGQIVQVPDYRNGWNTVSLRDAFKGPGQLLGPVNLDTHGYSDVWSNDISEVAIKARQLEDAAEAATWAEIGRASCR